jgi:hypothetical protein
MRERELIETDRCLLLYFESETQRKFKFESGIATVIRMRVKIRTAKGDVFLIDDVSKAMKVEVFRKKVGDVRSIAYLSQC